MGINDHGLPCNLSTVRGGMGINEDGLPCNYSTVRGDGY